MKIYFLFYAYETGIFAEIGGFRKLWELADRLYKQGIGVRIFFPRIPSYTALKAVPHAFYFLLNFPVLRPISGYLSMFFYALMNGISEKPDVIYFRTSANIFPVILARLLNAKLVLEVNAGFEEFHKTAKVSFLRRSMFSITERFNVCHSDRIIALTSGLKEELVKKYGVSPGKIAVIPSGTDTGHFTHSDVKQAKEAIGIGSNRPVIGFAGIFYPHQGVETLIYAAKYILKSRPETFFLIAGAGVMEKKWKSLTGSEGVAGSFLFTGQISYEKMPLYFNSMDIVVAPFTSARGETSPLKVLDALACGKPVVSSDIPSMRLLAEIFNGAIILVPPDDPAKLACATIKLISDEERREQLAEKGREVILEKFSWEMVADQVMSVLEAVK